MGSEMCIRDRAISTCDFIYMMDGWQNSRGAKMEYEFAKMIGIQIIFQDLSNIQIAEYLKDEQV